MWNEGKSADWITMTMIREGKNAQISTKVEGWVAWMGEQ